MTEVVCPVTICFCIHSLAEIFPQKPTPGSLQPKFKCHLASAQLHFLSTQTSSCIVLMLPMKPPTDTHMPCGSAYAELEWCFYTVCVCVQGRGVSCPRQPPSSSPMVNIYIHICSSDSSLWGSGCGM